jgi:hypothetical protein
MDGEGDNVELLNEPVFNTPPAAEQVEDQGQAEKNDQEDQEEQTDQEGEEEQEFVEPESLEGGAYPNAIQPIQEGGLLPSNINTRYTVSSFFANKEVSDIFEKKGKVSSTADRNELPSLFSLKNDFSTFTAKQKTTPVYILNSLSVKLASLITDDPTNFEKVSGTVTSTNYRKSFATYDNAKRTEVWTLVETIVRLYLVIYMCQKHASKDFTETFGNNKISSIEKTCEELLTMFDKVNNKPADVNLEDDIMTYQGVFYTYRDGETILTLLTDIGKAFLAEKYGIPYSLIHDSQNKYYFEDMFSFLAFMVHQSTPSSLPGTGSSPGPGTGTGPGSVPGTSTGTGTGSVPGPPPPTGFVRNRTHRLTGLRLPSIFGRGGGTRKLKVRKNNTLKSQ